MKTNITYRVALISATALAGPAFADDATEIAALRARLDALESREADSRLSFGNGIDGTKLTIYGYIKADLIYDLDSDLGTSFFDLSTLDPGAETGSSFRGQAIQSRIGFSTVTPSDYGDITTKLEGDFFGGANGGTFRLRHAYGTIGGFTLGQTWTNFMPLESYPDSIDFQGPAGIPFARATQLRYAHNFSDAIAVSASIEEAAGDSSDPAFTLAGSYTGKNYFLKIAGITNQLNDGTDAWGVNLSGNAQLWEGGSIQASYTMGEAIGSYDTFFQSDVFGGQAVELEGITLGISQNFAEKWTARIAYGYSSLDIGPLTGTESLETVHVGVDFRATDSTSFGLEYITGERGLFDGTNVRADRVQASAQFNF